MPRTARIVIPGQPHHVTHRGNGRRSVFFGDGDRRRYLDILRAEADRHSLLLHGYCLMSNHVHLIVTPKEETGLAKGIGGAHSTYSAYANDRLGAEGHLWHGRFYSCPMDRAHFIQALLYAERNPVRAGIVAHAWDYPWSSAALHTGDQFLRGILDTATWSRVFGASPEDWRELLAREQRREDTVSLRQATLEGVPWAEDHVLAQWEQRVGRPLRVRSRGRIPMASDPVEDGEDNARDW